MKTRLCYDGKMEPCLNATVYIFFGNSGGFNKSFSSLHFACHVNVRSVNKSRIQTWDIELNTQSHSGGDKNVTLTEPGAGFIMLLTWREMTSHSNRTNEIFLICCLEGDGEVISRIFKRARKSWILGNHINFDINCRDSSNRTGLILAVLSKYQEIVNLLLSR